MFINIVAKIIKVVTVAGLAYTAGKAAYSAAKAVKQTKTEVAERETEKTFVDDEGCVVHEKEFVSTKDKAKIFAKNTGKNFITGMPGKLGDVEEAFCKLVTVSTVALWVVSIGYIGCATDIELTRQKASKNFNINVNDDALKWTAWVADSYVEKCKPGTGYMFYKDVDGTQTVSMVETINKE